MYVVHVADIVGTAYPSAALYELDVCWDFGGGLCKHSFCSFVSRSRIIVSFNCVVVVSMQVRSNPYAKTQLHTHRKINKNEN